MSLTSKLVFKFNIVINNFNYVIEEIIRRSLSPQNQLAVLGAHGFPSNNSNFDLKNIFEKGIVWCPVPKKRTTAESKLVKKFLRLPNSPLTKYAKPKTNIAECLDCGNYHEKGTICGKCYQEVKRETDDIQNELFKDEKFKYNYKPNEIFVLYEGEEKLKEQLVKENKSLVEMPKKRPSWFNSNLLTKITT